MKRTAEERRYARRLNKLREAYHYAPKGERKKRLEALQIHTTIELRREVAR